MRYQTLFYSVGAISILLNVFYSLVIIPGREEKIEFWKNQCKIWRDSYFKQLGHEENKTEDAINFKTGWTPKSQKGADPHKEG